jgi:glycine/D-amino acid oxidase-like deaminating enzyme
VQTDFLIIGQGIAGTVLGDCLRKAGARIVVLSDEDPHAASRVAAGLYNPVTGKRMTKTWKAEELFPYSQNYYQDFEKRYACSIVHPMPVYKPFSSIEEQNTWLSAHDGEAFIDTNIPDYKYQAYLRHNWFGGFETKHSGYIDLPVMLDTFRKKLLEQNCFLSEKFDPQKLIISENGIQYSDLKATKIIFCEGRRAASNPLFSWLPFTLSKGEILKIKIQSFVQDTVLNKQVFIIPLGNDTYRVGSTYQWVFDNNRPTEKNKEELRDKLSEMILQPFEITEHTAGVRPSVKDRKPLVGFHPAHPAVGIFNGLGTKGVSLAPYFALNFAQHLTGSKQLYPEVNIERFYSLYSRSEY